MDAYALQRSWDRVTEHGEQVPLYFYSHLFVAHPEVRSMFPLSMSNQRDKFVSALGRIVSHANQIENDAAFLQHLGRDHRKYAVVADHYNAVGASLCATLKHFLGSEWDEELATHWTAASAPRQIRLGLQKNFDAEQAAQRRGQEMQHGGKCLHKGALAPGRRESAVFQRGSAGAKVSVWASDCKCWG